ncbi:hypothetical protein N0V88_007120 [Collariella sp. IMI 366227]|nr:hypothetical protein N0V88_007120 [Collariella sp. IMI 366227]
MPPSAGSLPCKHDHLQLDFSPHAKDVGFCREPLERRTAAAGGRSKSWDEILFPGPLVLPGDALTLDPQYPPQSVLSWERSKWRNKITPQRKTIYVSPPPELDPRLSRFLPSWLVSSPLRGKRRVASRGSGDKPPTAEQIRSYLEAFYHPLPVKLLPDEVRFVPWSDNTQKKVMSTPEYIGLQIGDSVTRITTRPCPDKAFLRQLDLKNILDAALAAVPKDAYALVMMIDHDMFEDEDDDFCCGRAYGGSRVCVVSSTRYHVSLDDMAGVRRDHAWPFSHCEAYMEEIREDAEEDIESDPPKPKRRKRETIYVPPKRVVEAKNHPMGHVIQASVAADSIRAHGDKMTIRNSEGLWLVGLVRTVSHELGHCFCLDHCIYYACYMQGTASIVEDVRQPLYPCLVCEAKLLHAIRELKGDEGEKFEPVQWQIERHTALAEFCKPWEDVAEFAGYRCWLEKRVEMLEVAKERSGDES